MIPNLVEAGECLTWPVYLRDYQVIMKGPLYIRDVACTDWSKPSNVVWSVTNGQTVTVIAENHGYAKIRTADGLIGWVWGPGWFKEVLTTDRFSNNQYVSNQWYGIYDTHVEFGHLFGNTTTPSPEPVTDEYAPEKNYNLSNSMRTNLNGLLLKVYTVIQEKSESINMQKNIFDGLVINLRKMQTEKEHLHDILEYLIDRIIEHKKGL